MTRYVVASVVSGILFGIMDGLINANPLAMKLYEAYQPIARNTVNVPAGIIIDLVYGFLMAGLFLVLYESLPGCSGLAKGAAFALITWFFRVVMSSISQWMMFMVPANTLIYTLVAGLGEMMILGLFYGLVWKRRTRDNSI